MRVIAGTAGGRRLKTLAGHDLRPTAGRVKEALFSMICSRFDLSGAEILDLFAGSGALGIEALSRGASRVTFVERSPAAARVLRENLQPCGFLPRSRILRLSARRALSLLEEERTQFDGVLVDPPYGRDLAHEALQRLGAGSLVAVAGWVVVEHHVDDPIAAAYGTLQLTRNRRYGKTCLALFSKGT